jgi:hypothetical protein
VFIKLFGLLYIVYFVLQTRFVVFGLTLMLIPVANASFFGVEAYGLPPDPKFKDGDCEFYEWNEGKNQSIECCWTDYTNTDLETGELIFDIYCQECDVLDYGNLSCDQKYKKSRSQLGGTHAPVTGGVLEPYKPPSLKDDAMNPLAGAGVEDQGSNTLPPSPTDQNIELDETVLEHESGTSVPMNKNRNTLGPLDTILGSGASLSFADEDSSNWE